MSLAVARSILINVLLPTFSSLLFFLIDKPKSKFKTPVNFLVEFILNSLLLVSKE